MEYQADQSLTFLSDGSTLALEVPIWNDPKAVKT